MKKVTAFSGLFLIIFGLTCGITVTFTQDAMAIDECDYECLYAFECRPNGPFCDPPYEQLYKRALCAGGPLNCPGDSYWIDICCILWP